MIYGEIVCDAAVSLPSSCLTHIVCINEAALTQ